MQSTVAKLDAQSGALARDLDRVTKEKASSVAKASDLMRKIEDLKNENFELTNEMLELTTNNKKTESKAKHADTEVGKLMRENDQLQTTNSNNERALREVRKEVERIQKTLSDEMRSREAV